ncbi:hypothetical protein Bca52824_066900 [Brassica carinata]|uniref:Uncharacterized protein n=1 Tax=Brassica carinata TaxID=52824 RepID=A0A8X7QL32_BRACI|nr:hypothetical protein Bca52824_066900 [Brassica carinata]
MVNCAWSEKFPMGRCRYLRFEGSDHRPLITYFNSAPAKKRGLFRFNRSLTENEEVADLVASAWNQSPVASVISKQNLCRQRIIQWSKERNQKANQLVAATQQKLDAALSDPIPHLPRIEALSKTLHDAYKEEEQFWLQ